MCEIKYVPRLRFDDSDSSNSSGNVVHCRMQRANGIVSWKVQHAEQEQQSQEQQPVEEKKGATSVSLIKSIISVGGSCSNCHCMAQGHQYYYYVDDDVDHHHCGGGDVLGEHDGLTPLDFFTCSVLSSFMGRGDTIITDPMNRRDVTDSKSSSPSNTKTIIDNSDINGIYPVKKPSPTTVSRTRKGNHLLGISTSVDDDDECTHGRRRSSWRGNSSVNRQRSDSSSSTPSTASTSTSSSSSHGQSLFDQQHRTMQILQQQNQQSSPTLSSQPTGFPVPPPPRQAPPQLLGALNTAARDSSIIMIPTFHQQHQYYHPRRRQQLCSIMGNAQLLSLMEEDGDLVDADPTTALNGGGDPLLLGQQPTTSQSHHSSSLPTSSVSIDDIQKQKQQNNLLQVHSSSQRQEEEEGDSSSSWSSVFASMYHIFGSDVDADVYDEGDDHHHHDVYTSSLPWLVSDLPFCWEIFGLNYHHYQATATTPSSTQSTAYPGTAATFTSTGTAVPEIFVLEFPARTRHRVVRRQVIDSNTPTGVGATPSTSVSACTTTTVSSPTAWSHQSQSFLEWIFSSSNSGSSEASNASASIPSPSHTLMIQQGQPEEQSSSLIPIPPLLSPSALFHNVVGINTSSTLGGATDASGEDEGIDDDDNGSVASTATTATMDSASFCPSE